MFNREAGKLLEMANLTRLDTLLVPNNPVEAVVEADWFLVLVEDTVDVADVLRLATAAKVSKRLTALASEAVKLGSETLMFVGEFLLSEVVELLEAVSIGTSEEDVEVGGGGGGGNAGGVTLRLKSSEAEKSQSLERPLVFLPEAVSEAALLLVVLGPNFLLRFLELLASSPRFMVSTKWAKLLAKLTTSVVFVASEDVAEVASEKNNCLSEVGKSPETKD